MHATLTVDLSALSANYRLLRNRFQGSDCAAVVKANAYGLGMAEVTKALGREGCAQFFVATLEEGAQLRAVLPDPAIYVFHGPSMGEERDFLHHGLIPVLNEPGQAERWMLAAGQAPLALHIDTGMCRLGFTLADLRRYRSQIAGRCTLLLSHLACANEPEHPKNAEQLSRFHEARALMPGTRASFVNSSGVFLDAGYHFDLARPGCALYGINPVSGGNPMLHVATLSAPILQIREVRRRESVGYGATWEAPERARLATVSLGYADGYPRMLSNRGVAYVHGVEVPVAGRVSMDMVVLDVSAVSENALGAGMHAEFISARQPVDSLADLCGTIGYEIFTRIGRRVKRIYASSAVSAHQEGGDPSPNGL